MYRLRKGVTAQTVLATVLDDIRSIRASRVSADAHRERVARRRLRRRLDGWFEPNLPGPRANAALEMADGPLFGLIVLGVAQLAGGPADELAQLLRTAADMLDGESAPEPEPEPAPKPRKPRSKPKAES